MRNLGDVNVDSLTVVDFSGRPVFVLDGNREEMRCLDPEGLVVFAIVPGQRSLTAFDEQGQERVSIVNGAVNVNAGATGSECWVVNIIGNGGAIGLGFAADGTPRIASGYPGVIKIAAGTTVVQE